MEHLKMPKPHEKLYLIDTMAYIFRSFYAIRYPMSAEDGTPTNALFGFIKSIEKVLRDFEPEQICAVMDSGSKTFRNDIDPNYKANRSECPEELKPQFALISKYLELRGIPILKKVGFEADDIIATLATQAKKHDIHSVILTGDKDLMQLIDDKAEVCHTHKDNKFITAETVPDEMGVRPDQIVDYLAMMGDSADNIPGLPGVGPKTAAKLLAEHGTLQALLDTPELAGKPRLVNIIRDNKDKALLSHKLVTLIHDVPLEKDATQLQLGESNWDELHQFALDMRLRQIQTDFKRIESKVNAGSAKSLSEELANAETAKLSLTVHSTKVNSRELLQHLVEIDTIPFDSQALEIDSMPSLCKNFRNAFVGKSFELVINGISYTEKSFKKTTDLTFDYVIYLYCTDTKKLEALLSEAELNASELLEKFAIEEILTSTEKNIDSIKVKYTCLDDLASVNKVLQAMTKKKSSIAFDCETTGLDPRSCEIVGIGLCQDLGKAFYIPFNKSSDSLFGDDNSDLEAIQAKLKEFFIDDNNSFFAHNAKFDLEFIWENLGIELSKVDFDTMIAAYLINPERNFTGMDGLCLHWLNYRKISTETIIGKGRNKVTMDQVDIDTVSQYCCEDVDFTLRLRQVFEAQIKDLGLKKLMDEMELPVMQCLIKMESEGIFADTESLAQTSSTLNERITTEVAKIYELAGEEFNIKSPKQVGEILFDKMGLKSRKKTATGYSTSQEVLEQLADEAPIVKHILEHRGLNKLVSTYSDALPNEIVAKTGRIHTNFSQTTAATGRLSSTKPNLQNIPVRSSEGRLIRSAFKAKAGHKFLACDYSQIELRVLAHMSEDPELLKAFNNDFDIHAYTASLVYNKPYEEVTKEERYTAKAVNFGIIYGQGKYGLAKELGITADTAAKFISDYFSRYPKIHSFMEQCSAEAKKSGSSHTMLGRQRIIPEIFSTNGNIRQNGERIAVNTPIQGSAADIIKQAMIDCQAMLESKFPTTKLLLQIHDELIFEVPEAEIDTVKEAVIKCMSSCYPLQVPLKVDAAVADTWAECD